MILVQYYPTQNKCICIEYINKNFAISQKDNFTIGVWKIKNDKL